MKKYSILSLTVLILIYIHCVHSLKARIINVPGDYSLISSAVEASEDGDIIIIHPGTHFANGITIRKAITITSEWYSSGDENIIDQTIINASDNILFSIVVNDVEISGLRIEDGDHTLDIEARATVKYCHFVRNKDPVSMEGNGGGYVGYCSFTHSSESKYDDAIDCDIGQDGPGYGFDIEIEHNWIDGTEDDGIEIRLFTHMNPISFDIHDNVIMNTSAAGIQLISYDVYTGKEFNIHHNVFINCQTGLGCMEGSNSGENLRGAEYMDEKVLFYNNTMINNQMGATGANNVIALNNIVMGGSAGGFKNFNSDNSVIDYNIFYNNGNKDLLEIESGVEAGNNIKNSDPSVDISTFKLKEGSICIDAGVAIYNRNNEPVLELTSNQYEGDAPDLGAMESKESTLFIIYQPDSLRRSFVLSPAYPNPFIPSTNISFTIPKDSYVILSIYDIKGREVSRLVNESLASGTYIYTWDPLDSKGGKLSSGMYLASLKTNYFSGTIKLILLE